MVLNALFSATAKHEQEAESEDRHQRADAKQHDQRDQRGEQAAGKFDQSRAQQIPHPLDVAHDARNQVAGFVRVVERNRQARNVPLNFFAQLGDQALRRLR